MGADFIGGAVPVRKTRDEALAALAALDDERVLTVVDDQTPVDDDETGLTVEAAREIAVKALDEVYEALDGHRRDGAVWKFADTLYVVTGGMSWGDTPTDLCDAVWLIDSLEVTA